MKVDDKVKWETFAFQTAKRTDWDVKIMRRNNTSKQVQIGAHLLHDIDPSTKPCYNLQKAAKGIYRLQRSDRAGLLTLAYVLPSKQTGACYITGIPKYGPKTSEIARALYVDAKVEQFSAYRDGDDLIIMADPDE